MTQEERNAVHVELMNKNVVERFTQKYFGSEYFDQMLEQIASYNETYEEKDFIPLSTFL